MFCVEQRLKTKNYKLSRCHMQRQLIEALAVDMRLHERDAYRRGFRFVCGIHRCSGDRILSIDPGSDKYGRRSSAPEMGILGGWYLVPL